MYDKDPKKFSDAEKYDSLTFMEVLNKDLRILDSTAISLCLENNLIDGSRVSLLFKVFNFLLEFD